MDQGDIRQTAEDLKGRAKQAFGDLTDNEDLKAEGEADEAKAKAKERMDEAREDLEDVAEAEGGREQTP